MTNFHEGLNTGPQKPIETPTMPLTAEELHDHDPIKLIEDEIDILSKREHLVLDRVDEIIQILELKIEELKNTDHVDFNTTLEIGRLEKSLEKAKSLLTE